MTRLLYIGFAICFAASMVLITLNAAMAWTFDSAPFSTVPPATAPVSGVRP